MRRLPGSTSACRAVRTPRLKDLVDRAGLDEHVRTGAVVALSIPVPVKRLPHPIGRGAGAHRWT
ncbi:hypothetical protein [Marinitenerispora sediminis]|uniref:hypothetical protein n=1 Tax=Marinitenerispora sediminis TaxID=1931232 RepID=UPI0011C0516D|nr:hypothetical protein [Marinitenerispora sediminis]